MFGKSFWLVLFVVVVSLSRAIGQGSVIRGTIIDDETGESLIGVSVVIEGTTTGAATDLDGQFQIKVQPGTYNLVVSFISFSKLTVNNVVVGENEVKTLGELRLKSSSELLKEIQITGKAVTNTEAALVTMKRKSANVIDGVSAASFKKIGDGDAASAVKRVTGVSVEGGKYIYVRGLGDRYTKTTLNGLDVPGLDPDRNSIQMDIFPTAVINNIVVSKTFSADLPGDFTGGAVNIELVDFPDEKTSSLSLSLGYNPSMNLNSNYLTYNGSSTDFLGFDNGKRKNPSANTNSVPQFGNIIGNPNGEEGQRYVGILNSFDKQMAGYRSTSLLNSGLSYSFANQRLLTNDYSLGYSFALSHSIDYQFYEDAEFNLYAKSASRSERELIPLERQKGDFSTENVLVSALAGVSLKNGNNKFRLTALRIQNGESKTGAFNFVNTNLGANFEANQFNLEYSQKSLTNVFIGGNHLLNKPGWELDWRVSPTFSTQNDPDIRFLRIRTENNRVGTEVGLPERIWRSLSEFNVANRVDFIKKTKLFDNDSKIKFGAGYTFKTRDFNIETFQFNPQQFDVIDDPNQFFSDESLFSAENRNGVTYNPNFIPNNPNDYSANVSLVAAYASDEFTPFQNLKAIVGVRFEKFDQFYTGTNQDGTLVFDGEKVIDDFNLFPSVNLIYAVRENQNLRFGFSRTIARPSLKEVSYAEIIDPITGRTFIGGLFEETAIIDGERIVLWDGNIESTNITNLDMRYEIYTGIGQNISISGFYKELIKPLEIVQFLSDPGSFQARNVGNATIIGTEIELIQSLAFLGEKYSDFSLNGNLTLVESSIDMSDSEFRSRVASAREGEQVKKTRTMAGQAPYIINTGISYSNKEDGLSANISYNVQGRTLQFVGFGNRTDVYSVPFHSLNLKVGKTFGKDDKMNVSLKVTNLLNDNRESVFSGFQAQDQLFQRLRPQRTFGVTLGYKF